MRKVKQFLNYKESNKINSECRKSYLLQEIAYFIKYTHSAMYLYNGNCVLYNIKHKQVSLQQTAQI
jgi:hypothetical protein